MKLRSVILFCIFAVLLISFSIVGYAGSTDDVNISSEYYGPLWDCNHDGGADYLDVSLVSGYYGVSGSPPETWSRADINNDGNVDYLDVSALSGHYGESWLI